MITLDDLSAWDKISTSDLFLWVFMIMFILLMLLSTHEKLSWCGNIAIIISGIFCLTGGLYEILTQHETVSWLHVIYGMIAGVGGILLVLYGVRGSYADVRRLCSVMTMTRMSRNRYTDVTGDTIRAPLSHRTNLPLIRDHEITPMEGGSFEIPGLSMILMPVPAGYFTMGSPESEEARGNDETLHRVRITRSFWMGRSPVTQEQWRTLTGITVVQQSSKLSPNTPTPSIGSQFPIYYVNWWEAMAFCVTLTIREKTAGRIPDGYEYRLPTEAEWEYACRAGTQTRYAGGDTQEALAKMGWYVGNSGFPFPDTEWENDYDPEGIEYCGKDIHQYLMLHAVSLKQPNTLGLHDMHGNIGEWCLDWYGSYPADGETVDPYNCTTGPGRVVRGGNCSLPSSLCRSASRCHEDPIKRYYMLGFRIVLAPKLCPPLVSREQCR